MKTKIDYTFTVLLIVLGVCHTSFTPIFYKVFDLNALWFAGTGMAFVFLGLINISRLQTTGMLMKILCSISNALALIFCILIFLKMAQPQVFISLFILLILLGFSLFDLRSSRAIR
ncbi:MAG: hypothetical protein JW927_06415 [Deltaproteobacteria bacterium]|nr:hypothetical protein [Deltaproteobacteria bacterium]